MIKFWFYIIVLVCLAVIGLTVGSANDSMVEFDFLVGRASVPVATVLVVGVAFGFVLGLYASLLLCLKFWVRERIAKSSLAKLKKQQNQVAVNEKTE
ncbi:MAG: LapA family protein [Aeromonadales bacterium]|nr:LapA family protein [Aeromonadales bacterium]